jgi:DNA-binding MarR family transcriptional regulator
MISSIGGRRLARAGAWQCGRRGNDFSLKLISRERSGIDRRAQHLNATEKGKALVGSAVDRLLNAEHELLLPLSHGERQLLLEMLQKVSRSRTG